MKNVIYIFVITLVYSFSSVSLNAQNNYEKKISPKYLGEPIASEGTSLLKDNDGKLLFIFRKGDWDSGGFSTEIYYQQSEDEGRTWTTEKLLVNTPGKVAQNFATVSPVTGEVILFYSIRGKGMMCARSSNNWKDWNFTEMKLPDNSSINTIGYGNSIWVKNKNGMRVICGFHGGGLGAGDFYSDDDGKTWKSSERVNVPNTIPNIWQTGAVEPTFAELSNGDILMILRNSNFHLWKSISKDKGASWSKPEESDLYCGDNSWSTLKNLKNGNLLLIWNNAKALRPEVTNDQLNFTGREVLHIAISKDDGKTWEGFRELMLDRLRDSQFVNHPGDKGLNESKAVETPQGNILVACGQAAGHRSFVLVDPDWITVKERSDNFENGIEQWSRQKIIKRPAVYKRYYHYNYDRKPGAVLVEHPSDKNKKVLHVRKLADTTVYSQRDGAVWNFTAGKSGEFETKIRLNKKFKGVSLALNDRWFQPIDNQGIETAMFVLEIPSSGKLTSNVILEKEEWYTIKLVWKATNSLYEDLCEVYVNDQLTSKKIVLKNRSINGVSYARFRSASRVTDVDGMYIEMVKVKTSN